MSLETDAIAIDTAAQEFAGNHREFDSFSWWDRESDIGDTDPAQWGIHHHENRDSCLLDKANAQSLRDILQEFMDADEPTVVETSFNHWACGWVGAFVIRVYGDDGTITPAFHEFYDAMESLQDYPVLDEELLSSMEHEDAQESWSNYGRSEFTKAIESAAQSAAEAYDDMLQHASDIDTTIRHQWERQHIDCPHTGIPCAVCACGECHRPDVYALVDIAENLDTSAVDRLWKEFVDTAGWDYQYDSGGCNFNIDDAQRWLYSHSYDELLELFNRVTADDETAA